MRGHRCEQHNAMCQLAYCVCMHTLGARRAKSQQRRMSACTCSLTKLPAVLYAIRSLSNAALIATPDAVRLLDTLYPDAKRPLCCYADLHVTASLPHHPDGRPLDGVTAQSTDHQRCLLAGACICCYCLHLSCCHRPHCCAGALCSALRSLRNS